MASELVPPGRGARGGRRLPARAARDRAPEAGEPAPHGGDVAPGGVQAGVQHHAVALAQHVQGRAAQGHRDVLDPLAAPPREGLRSARELGERGGVVAVGRADAGQHLPARPVDGVRRLRPRGPHERGEPGFQRRWVGGWFGGHRLGRAAVTRSGEHPRSIARRGGATDVHPLGRRRCADRARGRPTDG